MKFFAAADQIRLQGIDWKVAEVMLAPVFELAFGPE